VTGDPGCLRERSAENPRMGLIGGRRWKNEIGAKYAERISA
jgi:hypothetical protein